MSEWISVHEELPKNAKLVRVKATSLDGDTVGFAFFNGIAFECMMMVGGGPEGINPTVTHRRELHTPTKDKE
jgi:hypothetical protein